jgi:hypothetical protein
MSPVDKNKVRGTERQILHILIYMWKLKMGQGAVG